MRALIQRVSSASVLINESEERSISKGLMVLLGIGREDGPEDISWLARKVSSIRIFENDEGRVNLSTTDINGEILLVSQFTLLASTKKGNRPSLDPAAPPELAIPMYEKFISELKSKFNGKVLTGEFGASMKVSLVNEGPFTILIDSKVRE
ncbi:MAG: D-tyrosyl-tRNA(Tyr) deacylase [Spirochaetaceae bacterium]|nr:D-tyrosyl-tRNA(Tyr) deacylase [Spirochaetaceae bacterium]